MSNYTVLLIDYEPKSIDRIRRPLTGIGYRVEVATDGISGIEAFHRLKPDLVMIEAMIPKKHGFEVCQELKKTPQGKRTPVIITTSVYKGRKYRNQAFHLHGCDEYIEKPIDEQQVVEICQRMLGDTDPKKIPAEAMAPRADEEEELSEPASIPSFEAPPEPMAPPPPGFDDDEMEIMARLDAILPGFGDSKKSAPPPPAPMPPPMPPPAPPMPIMSASDSLATSFASETPEFEDAPAEVPSANRHDPIPLEEGTSAVALATQMDDAQDEDASQVVSFEPGRSRKKQRRKKGESAFSPQTGGSAVAAPVLEEVVEKTPILEPAARTEPAAVAMVREEPARAVAEPVPEFSLTEERRPWWMTAAIALVLLGAAGALVYLYLGGLFGGGTH